MNDSYAEALHLATEAALAAGALLREEFHRPGGPRSHGAHHANVDVEAERLIRDRLLAATPWSFLGEETGFVAGQDDAFVWICDPNDGTASYLKGMRGSAVSIALLHECVPVLGVVYSPLAPDDSGDLFAWAEDCGPLTRNGEALSVDLRDQSLEPGSIVIVSQAADKNPEGNASVVGPHRRYRALPSIAHRLALVAAGEGVGAVSLNGPVGWDYAAGHAALRAVGGELVDTEGQPITYSRTGRSSCGGRCFGGAPQVVAELASRPWSKVFARPKSKTTSPLVSLRPGEAVYDAERLSRAHGCLLAAFASESLGSAVEFKSAAEVQRRYPSGLSDMVEPGPVFGTLAGQVTDDGELTLALARTLVREGEFDPSSVLDSYVEWLQSGPFDLGTTTSAALRAAARATRSDLCLKAARKAARTDSQANGSLMRATPLGIMGWRDPQLAAEWARADSRITHPNDVCVESCAAYVCAIATAIHDKAGPQAGYEAALAEARRGGNLAVIDALLAAVDSPPERFGGWVLHALQNAFHELLHAESLEDAVIRTVSMGEDADTTGIVLGGLLGSVLGREAVPARWRRAVLTCRPTTAAGARVPRPPQFWPVDALELAELLLLAA